MLSRSLSFFLITAIFTLPASVTLAGHHKEKHANKHHRGLPPGLQKKQARGQALPPGWQKKLSPGKRMDRVVYESATPVTYREYRKYKVGRGEIAVRIDGKIVKLIEATRLITEVLED